MGKPQSKQEEIIIAQNGAGNAASATQDLQYHISTTNILLIVIITIIALVSLLCFYQHYKKTHKNWMRREINLNDLRRSLRRRAAFGRDQLELTQMAQPSNKMDQV